MIVRIHVWSEPGHRNFERLQLLLFGNGVAARLGGKPSRRRDENFPAAGIFTQRNRDWRALRELSGQRQKVLRKPGRRFARADTRPARTSRNCRKRQNIPRWIYREWHRERTLTGSENGEHFRPVSEFGNGQRRPAIPPGTLLGQPVPENGLARPDGESRERFWPGERKSTWRSRDFARQVSYSHGFWSSTPGVSRRRQNQRTVLRGLSA